jgi:hypothetical protein
VRPRTYALTFIGLAAGLFVGVVSANLVIDTQGVFGTGLLGQPLNANTRYQRFVDYQANASRYEGLLFGSSRALDLPLGELERAKGIAFASFAVQFGLIADDMPVLQYVLRDKAANGQRLRAVFLLLDPDLFGAEPRTNRFLQTMLAPAVTGEAPLRFWWRYLTAIQVGTWRGEIARALASAQAGLGSQSAAASARDGGWDATEIFTGAAHWERITARPDYARQLQLLRQFVELCRRSEVELLVAMSPLSRAEAAKYDPAELDKVSDDVRRIVPVWDFTGSQWLAEHPELWSDSRHFNAEVGRFILARVLGDAAVAVPADFGRLRTSAGR